MLIFGPGQCFEIGCAALERLRDLGTCEGQYIHGHACIFSATGRACAGRRGCRCGVGGGGCGCGCGVGWRCCCGCGICWRGYNGRCRRACVTRRQHHHRNYEERNQGKVLTFHIFPPCKIGLSSIWFNSGAGETARPLVVRSISSAPVPFLLSITSSFLRSPGPSMLRLRPPGCSRVKTACRTLPVYTGED